MKRPITVGLAILSALLAIACIYLLSVVHEKDEQLAAALATRQDAQARAPKSESTPDSNQHSRIADVSIRPPTPEPKVVANELKGAGAVDSKSEAELRSTLEGAARKLLNAIVQSKYSGLIKELQLTDSEAEKLFKILGEQQQIVSIDPGKMSAGKLEPPKPDPSRRFEGDRQARDLLGDSRFRKLQEYREITEGRNAITQLNSSLRAAGKATLSDEQRSKMFSSLAQDGNVVPPPDPSNFGMSRDYDTALSDWRKDFGERIKDRLSTVLTPDQLSVY